MTMEHLKNAEGRPRGAGTASNNLSDAYVASDSIVKEPATHVNRAVVESFLTALAPYPLPGGLRACLWFSGPKATYTFTDAEHGTALVAAHGTCTDVYVGIGLAGGELPRHRRLTKSTVAGLLGFGADLDLRPYKRDGLPDQATAERLCEELPLRPTVLVHTGHGLHAWWCFKEPWIFDGAEERKEARELSQAWGWLVMRTAAERYGAKLDNVSDLTRLLRVAGTTNFKRGEEPVPCTLLYVDGPRCNPTDFEDLPQLARFFEELRGAGAPIPAASLASARTPHDLKGRQGKVSAEATPTRPACRNRASKTAFSRGQDGEGSKGASLVTRDSDSHVAKAEIVRQCLGDLHGEIARDPYRAYSVLGLQELQPDGEGRWKALCPLHKECNPSFTIFSDGRWHCFGCRQSGDWIDLYRRLRGTGFHQALAEGCALFGLSLEDSLVAQNSSARLERPGRTSARGDPHIIDPAIVLDLHKALLKDPARLAWVQETCCIPERVIHTALIGYGQAGCWREPRIAIPIPSLDSYLGHETWVDIRGYLPGGDPEVLPFTEGRKPALYGWHLVGVSSELVFVEGEINALVLIARGFAGITATNGVSGALECALPDLRGKTVIVAPNDDHTGDVLRSKLPPRLWEAGAAQIKVVYWKTIRTPEGGDDHAQAA